MTMTNTHYIESLENIEEVKMSFSAKFDLHAEWFDQRLTWNDLNNDKFLNIPNEEVIEKLWIPTVVFDNTETRFETPLDVKSRILVRKLGKHTVSPIEEMEEIAYYKGSENSLQYSRDFFLRFKCHFELHYYPFDSQICTILMKKPSKVDKFVKLNPYQLEYTGPLDMAEFFIIGYNMVAGNFSDKFDIKVEMKMKRRISQHLLSTYLPSLCILIIAQVELAFKVISCHDFSGCSLF